MASEVFIVIDESTSRVITGEYEWDRDNGGTMIIPYGASFPGTPVARELFWRTDEKKLYRRNDGNTDWEAVSGGTSGVLFQEMHRVESEEEIAGFFTLIGTPMDVDYVYVDAVGGPRQVNKQVVGTTGVTPDFDVLNGDELHVNNEGGATGLSGDIVTNDVLIISYMVEI
jgi:hypothetical protein